MKNQRRHRTWLPSLYMMTIVLCCMTSAAFAQSPSSEPGNAGEPAESPDQLSALQSIQGKIEQVREHLAARKTDTTNQQQQQEIIETLQKLLQQQDSKSPKPQNSSQKTASKPEPKEKPGDSELEGNKSKRESETSSGTDRPDQQSDELSKKMQEKIWGHLPERVRDRMRSMDGERFLPKYEKLIRAYYERMASELSKD